jgi:hypothetical protein
MWIVASKVSMLLNAIIIMSFTKVLWPYYSIFVNNNPEDRVSAPPKRRLVCRR